MREDIYREKVLTCPFCMKPVMPPMEIETPFSDTIDGGICGTCGAIYVYDRSGRMLGEAMTSALAFAYNWDYDAAFYDDGPGYKEVVVRFDAKLKKFMVDQASHARVDRNPKYFFVKRNKPEDVG